MKKIAKQTYVHLVVFHLIVLFSVPAYGADVPHKDSTPPDTPAHYFTATYFHNSVRCPTCHKLEALSAKAIQQNFPDDLKKGGVVWRTINVDEPGNQHYSTDYQLFTKSLILSEIQDGKEIRWKNLSKIWTLVRDEAAFDRYVTDEVKEWLAP